MLTTRAFTCAAPASRAAYAPRRSSHAAPAERGGRAAREAQAAHSAELHEPVRRAAADTAQRLGPPRNAARARRSRTCPARQRPRRDLERLAFGATQIASVPRREDVLRAACVVRPRHDGGARAARLERVVPAERRQAAPTNANLRGAVSRDEHARAVAPAPRPAARARRRRRRRRCPSLGAQLAGRAGVTRTRDEPASATRVASGSSTRRGRAGRLARAQGCPSTSSGRADQPSVARSRGAIGGRPRQAVALQVADAGGPLRARAEREPAAARPSRSGHNTASSP